MAQIRQKRDRLDKSMKLGTVTLLTLLNDFRRVAQKSSSIILVKNMFYVTMATLKTKISNICTIRDFKWAE